MKGKITGMMPVLLFCLLTALPMQPQSIQWSDRPEKTYVFEISNKEAEKLLKSQPKDSLILKMLHHPVASFSGKWENQPKQGHFIFADIVQNKVNYSYVPIMPFQVFLYKEYGVLTLQVIDDKGNIRSDAVVKIKGRWRIFDSRVDFDKESHTYTIDDWSEKRERILTVELDKFQAVFNLSKHFVNPWYSGSNYYGHSPEFYGYMITDKNKYKPGETVRFKSYALSGGKKPLKSPLEVWMRTGNSYRDFKKLSTIKPYHKGGYAGEILLHDSLKLKLDKNYSIQLRDKKGRIVSNAHFKYEDYELLDNTLEVKLRTHTHYNPDTNRIDIRATDANGLFLQDVKADILVCRRQVSHAYTEILSMPDTLLYKRIDLENAAPTRIDIPAGIFGKADCTYEVRVQVLTFDNQRMTSSQLVTYYYSNYNLLHTLRNDTIRFEFQELGKIKPVEATLIYDNSKETKKITLPYEEPFKQSLRSYTIYVQEPQFDRRLHVKDIDANLDLTGGIIADSFNIALINPHQIDVSWYIYQGNILLQKGSGKNFDFKYPNTDLDVTHYVEVFYFMGDREQAYRRVFVPKKEYFSVNVDLPERIYPGQQVDATVSVKDYAGHPVKDVDVTAFAVNSLLNYHAPDLPYYGASPQTREQRSSYSMNKKGYILSAPLNFKFWNQLANLDEMTYYQFTYPWNRMFTWTLDAPDSTTQFSPYLMKNGNAVDIYVISCDEIPVYFSWTDHLKTYSFAVSDKEKHRISLRLHDRVILLDSMYFEAGKKTILSLDIDHLPPTVEVMKINERDKWGRYKFTSGETDSYAQYISRIPLNISDDYVYLKRHKFLEQDIYTVYHSCLMPYRNSVLAGPLPPQARMSYMNGVKYKHEGGFSYQYDENVVYKYPHSVCPDYLQFSSGDPVVGLNRFCLTPPVLAQAIAECKRKPADWHPGSIYISQPGMTLNFHLPEEKDSTGVSNLLFKDRLTGKIIFPDKVEKSVRKYSEIPPAAYDVILLYNSGKYLICKDVSFANHAYTEVDMSRLALQAADSVSLKWLNLRTFSGTIESTAPTFSDRSHIYTPTVKFTKTYPGNTVRGVVMDTAGELIIGCTVLIKGTTNGTITDMDGKFELEAPKHLSTLIFGYLGYERKEVDVTPGSEIAVVLEESTQLLEEVVVVGYGTQMRRNLTGAVAGISVSGDAPQPQSPPEKVEDDKKSDAETQAAEETLYNELLQLNGLRTNFSDVGFWQPALYTDRKGEAHFTATFPDNVTKWDAVVYAMNRKLKTGTYRQSVKSYKPLMAELKTPQFLVAGDSSCFAGNIRNYLKTDEIKGNILFTQEQDTLMNQAIRFGNSWQNKALVLAPEADSLSATWLFTRDDGYRDGEKRTISIEPQGTEVSTGTLSFLRNGEKQTVSPAEGEQIHIKIVDRQLDVYLNEYYYLSGYKYACNEQLASKLFGLLSFRLYRQYLGKDFPYDRQVNEIIKRLLENQNDGKLWSWWGRASETSFWMSAHILRALKMAKNAGYTVNLRIAGIEQDYVNTRPYRKSSLNDIEILHALSEWGTNQHYAAAVRFFEKEIAEREIREDSIAKANHSKRYNSYLKEKLLLWDIRQQQGLGMVSDSLSRYLKKDVLGAVYCDDGLPRYRYSDNLATTLLAYRIIRKDSALQTLMEPMRMYVLGTKIGGWNTCQSASVISTVLPDLLQTSSGEKHPATVVLSGKENRKLTEFPYETILSPGEYLDISKTEGAPLIYTAYSGKRVKNATASDAFNVSTEISGGDTLQAGVPVTLTVKVEVKQKNAEHIMIEVPIPAGCSYASKPNYYYGREVHREYFKEKTAIFCEKLPVGQYTFTVSLLPRYTGRYVLNPAKVEMMYFPVIHANNDLRKVRISE